MVTRIASEDARTLRYIARGALREVSAQQRVKDCGYATHTPGGAVALRHAEGVAGLAGLVTCGRVWLCPVCNSKVMARRALEVGAALSWVISSGHSMLWGALTVQHGPGTPLSGMLGIQRAAWRRVVSSKTWRGMSSTTTVAHSHVDACPWDCDRKTSQVLLPSPGRIGYLRAAEVTTGANGWHPHFHPLMVFQGIDTDALERHAAQLRWMWVDEVRRAGGAAENNAAQHLRVVTAAEADEGLAGYLTKATFDGSTVSPLEVVWSQGKARASRDTGTSAHWSILHRLADGEPLGPRWREFESSIGQHRALLWSRGLRDFAGVGAEVEDEDVAAAEHGDAEDTVAFISPSGWRTLRERPERVAQVLRVQESMGWAAVRVLLDGWGVQYATTAADFRRFQTAA